MFLLEMLQLHLYSRVNTWLQLIGHRQLQDETRNISIVGFGALYIRDFMVFTNCTSPVPPQISDKLETNERA